MQFQSSGGGTVADRTWEDPALVHYKTDLPPGTLPSTPLTQIWEPIYPDWTRWTWTAFGSTEWELAALGRFLCGEVTRKSWRTRDQIVSAAVGELQSEQLCFWEMDERKVNRRSGKLTGIPVSREHRFSDEWLLPVPAPIGLEAS
jgi:hypothetical protein